MTTRGMKLILLSVVGLDSFVIVLDITTGYYVFAIVLFILMIGIIGMALDIDKEE